MTTPHPDRQRLPGFRHDDDAFAVRLPRWRVLLLLGRSPLLRGSDRIEGLVLVLAIAIAVLGIPVAAAVGTVVHDARQQVYAEQAQDRRLVTAVVTDTGIATTPPRKPGKTIAVKARWVADGAEHTGVVAAQHTVKPGDAIDIWVHEDGAPAGAPTRTAVDEAVAAALALWLCVGLAAAALFISTRAALDLVRYRQWQRDFDSMAGDAGRH
ncbi:Rv1733c family protein [Mycobacterium branderi]|uniref:Membrane protein n=1 Tax=Mycobacterium branderi TaxID=43348 RepID=A0A7I7WAI7_9MYCO|nr:hypothetical protein [Mycobacterium branderi]MCV7232135.1 hypothetical protein [Mycobacterium branderi]ORA33850.1 hypothetical protein BST20_21740 [Mycobacterium branderi]BBZ14150.1 membrane protein [Mycobacterium branderi]